MLADFLLVVFFIGLAWLAAPLFEDRIAEWANKYRH